jgi:3-hydroxyisobutyrate dehydrogenase
MEVGYVGLGSMGGAIARRMRVNQQPLRVFDLVPARVSALAEAGAVPAQNLRALASASDMVCLCLPSSVEVKAAIFGEDGLAAGLKPGALVVDMTTGDPLATKAMAKELAERGVEMIDAPVSGGPTGAAAGTLAIMVGGTAAQFAKVKPVFEKVSPNVIHVGELGAGQTTKLVNNLLMAGCRAMTFEVMTLAVKNGLDPKICAAVLQKSSGRNGTTERFLPDLIDGKFPNSFSIGLMHKDVRLANQLAQDTGVPMLLGRLVQELHLHCLNTHGPNADSNMLIRDFEAFSGTRIAK